MRGHRSIAILVVVVALPAGSWAIRQSLRAVADQRDAAERTARFPAAVLSVLDEVAPAPDRQHEPPADVPVVLVFFRTDCAHCRTELAEIGEHEALRRTAAFWLVSEEDIAVLDRFAREEDLAGIARLRVWRDRHGYVREHFGVRRVPSTFVYGRDRWLLGRFDGVVGAGVLYGVMAASHVQADPASASRGCAADAPSCRREGDGEGGEP